MPRSYNKQLNLSSLSLILEWCCDSFLRISFAEIMICCGELLWVLPIGIYSSQRVVFPSIELFNLSLVFSRFFKFLPFFPGEFALYSSAQYLLLINLLKDKSTWAVEICRVFGILGRLVTNTLNLFDV